MHAIPAVIHERLRQAAASLRDMERTTTHGNSTKELRDEQVGVFADFSAYLAQVVDLPDEEWRIPMCRIIQPPRTGKTVIAGHIIASTGLDTLFLVPTRTLIEQTVNELRKQLPTTPIGVYYGETKGLVPHGVNVATYTIAHQRFRDGRLPEPFQNAALVFADEAHQTMTRRRLALLRNGFAPRALRIALTATPDYNDRRVLAVFFPDLVHEITLTEALELDLLAPLRVWVAEVDEAASSVKVFAGDYQEETLGRIMSAAPFFRAAEYFRYHKTNAKMQALICCVSRQQAYDLWQYLVTRDPARSASVALILGDTPGDERRDALERFEQGSVTTLINVGVLIQGWNAPQCKLLIDLAPSVSHVRAMQKFFRVMTRQHDAEARIYMILPKDLPRIPLYPMDFLGLSSRGYVCGELIGKLQSPASTPPIDRHANSPIRRVRLKHRITLETSVRGPKLNPRDANAVRQVVRSNPEFDGRRLIDFSVFRWLAFDHDLFSGRGEQLLRYIGVAPSKTGYEQAMARLFPEASGARLLTIVRPYDPMNQPWKLEQLDWDRPCREDPGVQRMFACLAGTADESERAYPEDVLTGWKTLGGHDASDVVLLPDTEIDNRDIAEFLKLVVLNDGAAEAKLRLDGPLPSRYLMTLTEADTLRNMMTGKTCKDLAHERHASRSAIGQCYRSAILKVYFVLMEFLDIKTRPSG